MSQLSSAVTYQSKQHKKNHRGAKVLPEVAILSFYWQQTIKIFGMVFFINNVFFRKIEKKKIFRIWRQIAEIFKFFSIITSFIDWLFFYLAFLQEKWWNSEMVFWKDCKFPSFLKQKFWSGIFTFGGKQPKNGLFDQTSVVGFAQLS